MTQSLDENLAAVRSTSVAPTADATPIIYYDGSCPLCSVEIKYYASRCGAGGVHLADVSSDCTQMQPDLTKHDAMRRFHVRTSTGELLSGARAFIEIWRSMPGWTWAARLARVPGVTALLELSYSAFLVVRPVLSYLAGKLGVQAHNPYPKRH